MLLAAHHLDQAAGKKPHFSNRCVPQNEDINYLEANSLPNPRTVRPIGQYTLTQSGLTVCAKSTQRLQQRRLDKDKTKYNLGIGSRARATLRLVASGGTDREDWFLWGKKAQFLCF